MPSRGSLEALNRTGTLIDGRYLVEQPVGHGTMGSVYRGRDIALARTVAIKFLFDRPDVEDSDMSSYDEARAIAQVRHDNVVQIYALGEQDGRRYIAMEYVEGRTLEAIIEEHCAAGAPIPVERALAIIRRVTIGLGAVHAKGVVHRDVKPSNIMIEDGTGRPVLIDFGLARQLSDWNPAASRRGCTPCYVAPEVLGEPPMVSAQSDIYSLACTAFELLTGRSVFPADNLLALLTAHTEQRPPSISSIRPELSAFDEVFARALEKQPEDRYATCEVLLDALDRASLATEDRQSRRELAGAATQPEMEAVREPSPLAMSVIVLERADGLRRNIAAVVKSTLGAAGDEVSVDCIASEGEIAPLLRTRHCVDMIIIDDDKTRGRTVHLIEALRRTPRASSSEIVVLARDDADWPRFRELGVAAIPKPCNMRVLGLVVARLGRRIVERRSQRLGVLFSGELRREPLGKELVG